MSYEIQAIVADVRTLALLSSSCTYGRVFSLKQGFGLIPVVDQFFDELQSRRQDFGFQSTEFEGFFKLSSAVAFELEALSQSGPVAYIEAEFFGGTGGQSSVAWANNSVSFGPEHSKDAINRVLRYLGVQATGMLDEFDTMGLGRNRRTERWFSTEVN